MVQLLNSDIVSCVLSRRKKKIERMIRLELTSCSRRDVKVQELTN